MQRRTLLKGGAGLAALSLLPGCGEAGEANTAEVAPAAFEMPLESAPHERTLMQWPVSLDVYDRPALARVQASIALIANTISRHEPVALMCAPQYKSAVRAKVSDAVEIWDIPTDDLWCRDSGPTFVQDASGALAVAHIRFNGWGRKQPHANDALVAERVAKRLNLPLLPTGLVGEQGGVEHDGAGTLLAHASCWANANRSSETQDQIGDRLLRALGGEKMIWAPGVAGKDITDYHIDALARFVGPAKVLIQLGKEVDPDDPWSVSGHETLRILQEATDAFGRKLEIIRLDDPVHIRSRKADFVASYVNYYVCNGAVIAAQFGDEAADAKARDLLQSLYPGRVIEMLDIDPIGESGGGIHCATQQMPAALSFK
ncbi:MAG TPA: agmatine deiminase family protein [Chakrabartia sp.]|nr:agmatine deiminase family protein [Chakrabartia sp.]